MVPSHGNSTTNFRYKMIDSEMIAKLTLNGSLNLLRKIYQQTAPLLKKNEREKTLKYDLANSSFNKRYIGISRFRNKLSFSQRIVIKCQSWS